MDAGHLAPRRGVALVTLDQSIAQLDGIVGEANRPRDLLDVAWQRLFGLLHVPHHCGPWRMYSPEEVRSTARKWRLERRRLAAESLAWYALAGAIVVAWAVTLL